MTNNTKMDLAKFAFRNALLFALILSASVDAQHLRQQAQNHRELSGRNFFGRIGDFFKGLFDNKSHDPTPAPVPTPISDPTPTPTPAPQDAASGVSSAQDDPITDLTDLEDLDDEEIANGSTGNIQDGDEDIAPLELERILIDCPESIDFNICSGRIKSICDIVGGNHIKMLYDLPMTNAVALTIHASIANALRSAVSALPGFEMEQDVSREPLYLPDSVRVLTEEEVLRGDVGIKDRHRHLHLHRNLQSVGPGELTYGVSMVNAPDAWSQFGTTGEGIRVCVIDSGLLSDHPDLSQDKIEGYSGGGTVSRWNSDASGHGTHVTGTIAARPNGRGVVGVAPDVDVYVVRVFSPSGRFFGSDVIAAGEACVSAGAKVISMSLGGPGDSLSERRFFNRIWNTENILAIAASGNDGRLSNRPSFPAAYNNVMSVAAVDRFRNVARFSTYNSLVDIAGPGVDVLSTWNDGGYSVSSGTSMATPHVSGVAALLFGYKNDATVAEVTNAMQNSAQDRGSRGRDDFYGHGIVDALGALQLLSSNGSGGSGSNPTPPPVPSPTPPPVASPTPAPGQCLDMTLTVITDGYGYENSFSLRRTGTNEILFIERTLQSNTRYTRTACLRPTNCYRFAILDTFGDGIFGSGRGAQIRFGNQIVYSRRSIGSGEIFFFGGGCPES